MDILLYEKDGGVGQICPGIGRSFQQEIDNLTPGTRTKIVKLEDLPKGHRGAWEFNVAGDIVINPQKKRGEVKQFLKPLLIFHVNSEVGKVGFDDMADLIAECFSDEPGEQAIGKAGQAFRKAVKAEGKNILNNILADEGAPPTREAVLALLPVLTLP